MACARPDDKCPLTPAFFALLYPARKSQLPITIRRTAAGFEFLQTMAAPAIYFDHWAVRRFSEQQEIQERFVHALRRAGGTLLISLTNFGEFSAMTDRRQAIEAERFLDRVLPSLYIADFGADPGFLQAQGRLGPRPDNLIFRQMAEEWDANGHRLSTRTLITDSVDHRNIVQPTFEELKAGVAAAVNRMSLFSCQRTFHAEKSTRGTSQFILSKIRPQAEEDLSCWHDYFRFFLAS